MSNFRIWFFRALVIITAGLLILSWFMPWWTAYIEATHIPNTIVIHPYGLENNMGTFDYFFTTSEMMPGFFTPLMWIYFVLVIAALLIGTWVKNKDISLFKRKFNLSRWLIGIVGFSYIVVVVLAYVVASIKTAGFDLPFVGRTYLMLDWAEQSWVDARLRFGYWLACGIGPFLIILALLRNKIIGKTK